MHITTVHIKAQKAKKTLTGNCRKKSEKDIISSSTSSSF